MHEPWQSLLNDEIRQERDVARALDRAREHSMMLGAVARGTAGDELAALGDEISQKRHVFIIDIDHAIDAEAAGFAAGGAPPPGSTAAFFSARTARSESTSVTGCCTWCW